MTQPAQVYNQTQLGSPTYIVIDAGAPFQGTDATAGGNSGGTIPGGQGYDNDGQGPYADGAVAQGINVYTNGNIPDAIASAKITVTAAAASVAGVSIPTTINATIKFRNPA